jgi:GDP-L-fucose synthase
MLGASIADAWRESRPEDEFVFLTRADADLRDRVATKAAIAAARPDSIIHAAAKVGGAGAKVAAPTGYLVDNLLIDSSVLTAALEIGVPELLYVSSAAIYPAEYERPFVEADVLGGQLEGVNEGYAIAKLAGLKICEYASREFGLSYRSVVPSNLYGVHDHFDLASAHLVSAAIAKMHAAREEGLDEVSVWGDGTARREFTFVGDVAAWLVGQIGSLADWPPMMNLGCGEDHTVAEYYEVARDVVGFEGRLSFDESKPSGVARRLLDSSVARQHGWNPTTPLNRGMTATYADYLARLGS